MNGKLEEIQKYQIKHTNLKNYRKKQISSITSKLEQIQKYQKFTPVKYRTYI